MKIEPGQRVQVTMPQWLADDKGWPCVVVGWVSKVSQKAIELKPENVSTPAWLPLSQIEVKVLATVSVHDFEVFSTCEHCEKDKPCVIVHDEMICMDCFEKNYGKPAENRVRSVIVVDDEMVQQIAHDLIPVLERYREVNQWETKRLKEKYGEDYLFKVDDSPEYVAAIEIVQSKIKVLSVLGGTPLMEDVYYALNQKDARLASTYSFLADGIGGWAS